jgi:predicted Rossmann fold flavoprotein
VLDVTRVGDRFLVTTSQGELTSTAVVLATGGQSLPKTGSDGAGFAIARRLGHTTVATTPGLVPLLIADDTRYSELAGVAQDVELAVWLDGTIETRLRGPLLWTHFGVSGPVAMNASRLWLRAGLDGRAVSLTINFCGGDTFERVDDRWTALALERPKMSVQHAMATIVPAAVATVLLRELSMAGGSELAHLTRDARRQIVHALVAWPLRVSGTRGYNYAEVTAGGVTLTEIDPATMESRVCPGLYLVGEILDVDGRIGGFNFQWAWSSGRVAGTAVARP